MPSVQLQVGPDLNPNSDNSVVAGYAGESGEYVSQQIHGRYYEQAIRGSLFIAHAAVTSPVIYTTAAGTGGPFIWNSSTLINVAILAVTIAETTASSVAGAIGLTGGPGMFVTTATTAITSRRCGLVSQAMSRSNVFATATPSAAGRFFLPLYSVETGTLGTSPTQPSFIDIGGAIVIPPNSWASIAASATLTSGVYSIGVIYEEAPA